MKRRTVVVLTFASVSFLLTAMALYTSYYYFEVYRATHVLDIKVKDFNITFLDSTYALTQTELLIINPSQISFEVIRVAQRLTYDQWGQSGTYITGKTDWFEKPRLLQPSSNMSVEIEALAPSTKIEFSKTVFAELEIFLRGPLIGEFLFNSFEILGASD